jgi:hypothetical protein
MSSTIFLDTCILFSTIERSQDRQVLQHLHNLNYPVSLSLSILGEFTSEINFLPKREQLMRGFFDFVDTFDPIVMVPNSRVSYACYLLCKFNEDDRMKSQQSDLVHLGYAMAYNVPVFLTTDKHLTHYRIPHKMIEKGYKQPRMMDLSAVKREYR